jgi:hypothetical protein
MKAKNILILIATLFMVSCAKKDLENTDRPTGLYIDTVFDIIYNDSIQNDLLDSEYTNRYNVDQIKLLNLIDGKLVEFYKGNLDNPKGYKIYYRTDFKTNVLSIQEMYGTAMNKREDSDNYYYEITSFLQLSETVTDTIRMEVLEGKNPKYWVARKIWYNNELKWDKDTSNAAQVIRVMK